MRIGIDFDNTIVCYDSIFHAAALERGLIPRDLAVTKGAVRDHLRRIGQEERWTELQGYVYGPALARAEPFPGVWDFLRACNTEGIETFIVSHKTRHPFMGPAYDLHAAALDWIRARAAAADVVLDPGTNIFLELTKSDKLRRIGALGCDWFVDDLPEFLAEPEFPSGVRKILFDPAAQESSRHDVIRAGSWREIADGFFGSRPWS